MNARKQVEVVPSTSEVDGASVVRNVPGNAYDKHGSTNPVVMRLMERFHHGVLGAIKTLGPDSVLDVGCGEGRTTALIADAVPGTLVGLDLEESVIREAADATDDVQFLAASVYGLPFRSDAFDVVYATEMLEHIDRPYSALEEMTRVARSAVIVTVPHEPWWRLANMARGRYLSDFGNTPGHVQHWSRSSFSRQLAATSGTASVRTLGLWLLGVIHL